MLCTKQPGSLLEDLLLQGLCIWVLSQAAVGRSKVRHCKNGVRMLCTKQPGSLLEDLLLQGLCICVPSQATNGVRMLCTKQASFCSSVHASSIEDTSKWPFKSSAHHVCLF
ncbi:hypothetical protein C8F01DRAFT_1140044 [Mycena amicta]|nr:hypothetical protein C8F01DRAFT_1140044 [Mycena amicta]